MARAIWSGAITFGLVSIPIKLYSATENHDIAFHQLHDKCKTRIKELRWCPTCKRAVEWDEIEKGFEYAKGEYVVITKDDLEKLPLASKQTIAIQEFVKLDQIDPIYFEKAYYLEPEESAFRSLALFLKVLKQKDMIGIGSVALRNKERLCCLRPVGDTLLMETLLYPDEIRVQPDKELPKVHLSAKEMEMANTLVDMMAQSFDPKEFKDHYREALQKVIDAKLEGEEISAPPDASTKVYDLMDALRASVARAKTPSKRTRARKNQVSKKTRKAS